MTGAGEGAGQEETGPDTTEGGESPATEPGRPAPATGDGTDPGEIPPGGGSPEERKAEGVDPEEDDEWEEEEGDLETAELDALLRAAKTKVLSYEEAVEKDEEEGGWSEERDEREEDF